MARVEHKIIHQLCISCDTERHSSLECSSGRCYALTIWLAFSCLPGPWHPFPPLFQLYYFTELWPISLRALIERLLSHIWGFVGRFVACDGRQWLRFRCFGEPTDGQCSEWHIQWLTCQSRERHTEYTIVLCVHRSHTARTLLCSQRLFTCSQPLTCNRWQRGVSDRKLFHTFFQF